MYRIRAGSSFVRNMIIGTAALAVLAAASAAAQGVVDYAAIIAAPDRSDADRKTDERRDPTKLLAFTGVQPGMTVLDMGAGAGYSTELMARAAAPNGKVFGQDDKSREKFEARAKTPAMAGVTYLVRPYDDPVPADVRNLDLITFFFAYHDVSFANVDRARMNNALFDALKPGGFLVLADHSARPGDGTSVASTFHRIEESVVKNELTAAGFRLVSEGDFLHNPQDARDTIVFKSPVKVDEFVLKFQKPN
jgi:predicted methyltransferase